MRRPYQNRRSARVVRPRPRPHDRIVNRRSRPTRRLEPQPDLDALHGGDRHQDPGEAPIEFAIPADMRAEADRKPLRHHLDFAAERVAIGLGLVDPCDHCRAGDRVERAHRRGIGGIVERGRQDRRHRGANPAERDEMRADVDAELGQQSAGDRTGGDACRGLAGGGALEDVACIDAIILQHADEIGVAGAWAGHTAAAQLARRPLGRHHLFPVGPVAIVDQHRDRRADCLASADAGDPLDAILLDLHAGAAAVALHAAAEVRVDGVGGDRQPGGDALDEREEGLAVRFTGGAEGQWHSGGKLTPGGGGDARGANDKAPGRSRAPWSREPPGLRGRCSARHPRSAA